MSVVRDLSKLQAGEVFGFHDSKYKVLSCIFQGPFSSVYKLLAPDDRLYAMKVESKKGFRNERAVLKMDVVVLRDLAGQTGFVPIKEVGRNADWKVLLMDFIGPDLGRLQKLMPEGKFTTPTAYHIALEVLDRMESLHAVGYLHRDLKAANLAVGLGDAQRTVYMLDFGMCRKYVDSEGKIVIRRKGPICGTIPFASQATNCMEDMGPRDDLENWFFVSLYAIRGRLPWYCSEEDGPHFGPQLLQLTREWKRWCLEVDRPALFGGVAKGWEEIYDTIRRCGRDEPAPIALVRRLVKDIVEREHIDLKQPLDWQVYPQLVQQLQYSAARQTIYPKMAAGDRS